MSVEYIYDFDDDYCRETRPLIDYDREHEKLLEERRKRGLSDRDTGIYAYEFKKMLEQVPDTARIGLLVGISTTNTCFEIDAEFLPGRDIMIYPRSIDPRVTLTAEINTEYLMYDD